MTMNTDETGRSLHVTDELYTITKGSSVAVAAAALVIPVTHNYVAKTTGGAEALTLANGKPGQILTVALTVDGGNGTLTPATATGFTAVVLGDAGDHVTLKYIDDTVGWILMGASGAAAPPVITI